MKTKRKIIILAAAAWALTEDEKQQKRRKANNEPINSYVLERQIKGRYWLDFEDLVENPRLFFENFHMDYDSFQTIFELVEPHLRPTNMRRLDIAIAQREKVAAVIEYLASGSLQKHIASIYRISKQAMGRIIEEVCEAIVTAFGFLVPSMNKENFLEVSKKFLANWQFPHCLGAIDGKHIALKAPANAGSLFYNYKGFHSVVLMAIADAEYKFIYFDVGAYGSESDAGVFAASEFGKKVLEDQLDFPPNASIDGKSLPFFFIGDDAFPLCKRILKPYGGKKGLSDEELIFNYRLSRARRCVENAFGILSAKWICLRRTMFCSPDKAQKIVAACCLLHNFFLKEKKDTYCPVGFADRLLQNGAIAEGEWRKIVATNSLMYGSSFESAKGRHTDSAKFVREEIKRFVNSSGAVEWQRKQAFVPLKNN